VVEATLVFVIETLAEPQAVVGLAVNCATGAIWNVLAPQLNVKPTLLFE